MVSIKNLYCIQQATGDQATPPLPLATPYSLYSTPILESAHSGLPPAYSTGECSVDMEGAAAVAPLHVKTPKVV